MINNFLDVLSSLGSEERARHSAHFFKTGKGQYGEGDVFLGLSVPEMRQLVKQYREEIEYEDIFALLNHEWHEARFCALLLMMDFYKKGDAMMRADIYERYWENTHRINNWDLVDVSSHWIVGDYLLMKEKSILFEKIKAPLLWDRRVAMVCTWGFIKKGYVDTTFSLAAMCLDDTHDLMHKAAGWMLREAGKKDEAKLLRFLDEYAHIMPRTMLRYSLEKLNKEQRGKYMKKQH